MPSGPIHDLPHPLRADPVIAGKIAEAFAGLIAAANLLTARWWVHQLGHDASVLKHNTGEI
jgi:hypothetical protein